MSRALFPTRAGRAWAVALIAALLLPLGARAGIDANFSGNKEFSNFALRDRLPEEPEKLDDDEVSYWGEDAAYEIEQAYLQLGYFQVKVSARTERPDASKKDWRVSFTIDEGPRYRFGAVNAVVDGDTVRVRRRLQAREGAWYEEQDVVRDVRDITRFYGNAGFVRAEVHENVTLLDSLALARVDYNIDRGEAVVFGRLRVNVRRVRNDSMAGLTREDMLRDLVPYKPGDTVRADVNDKIIEKLQSTGQYNSVRLEDTVIAPGQGSLITLDVEEKVPGNATASIFYETQYGFGVSAGVRHSNVAGTLNEVRLDGSLAQNKQGLVLGYGSPLTMGLLMRFDNDFSIETFQDKLPGEPMFGGDLRITNNASLSRGFSYWLRGLAGAEVEYKSLLVGDSLGNLSRESGGLLNFTGTGFVSFLDQPLNPARGARFALTLGNGGPIYEQGSIQIFSDRHNWIETRSAVYYYVPPVHQFKVAFRLDGGRFFGAGGQNSERFFLGGPRSVRSYGFRQLCPDAPAPARGSCPLTESPLEPAYVLASAELRLSPLNFAFVSPRGVSGFFKPLEFVPFVDFGKVWNLRSDNPALFSPEFGAEGDGRGVAFGGGLRYPLLGIFNLRLDFAWGRPGGGNWPDQWVVDLAQAF